MTNLEYLLARANKISFCLIPDAKYTADHTADLALKAHIELVTLPEYKREEMEIMQSIAQYFREAMEQATYQEDNS